MLLQPHPEASHQHRPTLASHLVLVPRTQIDNLVELRRADATDGDHDVGIWHLGVTRAVWAGGKVQVISANVRCDTLK